MNLYLKIATIIFAGIISEGVYLMANCGGIRIDKSGSCARLLFRCQECGNVGCDTTRAVCSNQGFLGGRCKRCGKAGTKQVF